MRKQKFLAALLAVVMLFTLVPVVSVSADEAASGGTQTGNSGLHLDKSVEVQDDGTYTITLEAYATGTVTTSTTSKPCDIVLLLDQSGSMSDVLGTTTGEGEYSANSIANASWSGAYLSSMFRTLYYKTDSGYVPVIVTKTLKSEGSGWSGDTYTYAIADADTGEIYKSADLTTGEAVFSSHGLTLYSYELAETEISKQEGLKTAAQAFIEATGDKNDAITDASQKHRISIVKFAGTETDTTGDNKYTESGYNYNYTQIVTELTSDETKLLNALNSLSEAGATSADYGMNRASAALGNLSTDDGREKIIIMFTDGEPNHGNGFDASVAASTVKSAKTLKDNGVTIYTIGVLKNADPTADPQSSSTSNVNKYLHAVSSNYPEATATGSSSFTVTWGTGNYTNGYYKTASTSDELTGIFQEIQNSVGSTTVTLDGDAVLKDVISDSFVIPEGFTNADNVRVQTAAYKADGTFDNPVDATGCTVSVDGKTIDVTGFSYKDNYCVVVDGTAQGKKLIVTIAGIEVDPTKVVANNAVTTNEDTSGIYEDGTKAEAVKTFNQPTVALASKSYVIDYAKSFTMNSSDWLSSVKHVADNTSKITNATTNANIDLPNGKVEGNNGTYTYTPQTTSWNGYDSFYAFGTNTSNEKLWSSVNVIPANNVYYEDTFETDAAGTVGIEYTGSWTKNTDSSTSNTSESVNTETHGGWQNANLADDTGYSDGTAHTVDVSDGSQATATFKFTGTGFDVYSHTNSLTGTVVVIVRDESGNYVKGFSIDTVSRSDEYDGVPTLSVLDLEHGTYNVTIYVTSAANTAEYGNRATYYIDGIRIYNPLGNDLDTTVSTAYGDEINASFQEVRDILIDAKSFGTDAGVVFIDQLDPENTESDGDTNEIGVYESYGPENEVYLAAGQSIVFKVDDTEATYHIGFRSPTGADVTVEYSAGTDAKASKTINHTTDLYYKVTPNTNGTITITNTSDALLSVTKIRTSGAAASQGLMLLSMTEDEALDTVAAFSLMRVVDTEEEPVDPEAPATDPDDSQDTTEEPEEPEIDIVNPEPENKPEIEEVKNELNKLVTNLFKNIFKWFGRR